MKNDVRSPDHYILSYVEGCFKKIVNEIKNEIINPKQAKLEVERLKRKWRDDYEENLRKVKLY